MRQTSVYEINNTVDAKAYIGVAANLQARLRVHRHHVRAGSGFKLHAAVRKHGAENFRVRTRAVLPGAEEAFIAERILIALERPEYNLTEGGEGMRATPEIRAKISTKSTGRKHTDEARVKIREARALQTNVKCGPFDAAHRDKIRKANTGKTQSAESRAKKSETLKRAYAEGRRDSHFRTCNRAADGRVLPRNK